MDISPEEIKENFDRFRTLCTKLGERSDVVLNMVDSLAERLALCPASAKKSYHLAMPGGLVRHSLDVLGNAMRLTKAFSWNLPKDSLIISCLFHDIGKVGSPTEDFYVPQTDSWRREKLGEEYTYNDELVYMSTPERSLFLCQHFGVKLTHDEHLAIKLNDGFVVDENKQYCLKISQLVWVVQTSDYVTTCNEKGMPNWPVVT